MNSDLYEVFYVVIFYCVFKTKTIPLRKHYLLSSVTFTFIFKKAAPRSSILVAKKE